MFKDKLSFAKSRYSGTLRQKAKSAGSKMVIVSGSASPPKSGCCGCGYVEDFRETLMRKRLA